VPDQLLRKRVLFDRFTVERTLGRGGMATVYLARDRMLERLVALKVLSEPLAEDPPFRERFLREARLAARLVHPNVVQVYDVGETELGLTIVMEYVEGETLAAELQRRGRLPADEVVSIAIQLCSALQAAHAERLVHRDIKPQNVLRRADRQVKLADFGIARSLAATRHTALGTVLGTAAYLSPEQARGERVTASADLYSLGVVLYELLTGEVPFTAESLVQLMLQREESSITPPSSLAPDIPPALEAVVLQCLELRPKDRPDSAASLARELAGSVDEPATVPLPAADGPRAREVFPEGAATVPLARSDVTWPRRLHIAGRRRRLALAAVFVVAASIIAVALAESGGSGRAPTVTTTHRAAVKTAPKTTAARTTTAQTTTARPITTAPAATPEQALAATGAALAGVLRDGQIDQGSANDLSHRLDDIAKALAAGNSADTAHKAADLSKHLADLARAGKITAGGLTRISTPLDRLAALLPSLSAPPPHHGDHHQGPKPKHDKRH